MLDQNQKSSIQYFDFKENKTIYELKSGAYKKVSVLGQGTFGKVLLVQKLSTDKEKKTKEDSYYFALKISRRFRKVKKGKNSSKEDEKNEEEARQEINFIELRELTNLKILSKTNHLNIVNMLDFHVRKPKLGFLLNISKLICGNFILKTKTIQKS